MNFSSHSGGAMVGCSFDEGKLMQVVIVVMEFRKDYWKCGAF
jgi:hypothetical protein